MRHIDRRPLGFVCGGLVVALFLGAALAAGCGRVNADDTGSETHWLASCGSDADCDQGSCECGVCTRPCDTTSDCSELAVAGVECAPPSSECGSGSPGQGGASAAASGSACLLQCASDADCGVLGAQAFCRAERCELQAAGFSFDYTNDQVGGSGGSAGATTGGTASGGQGGSTGPSSEIATLCDGSDDVRLAYMLGGGFVSTLYPFFSDLYGHRSFAIDGQCRFWETKAGDGWVYTGTVNPDRAQDLARAMGYGRFSEFDDFIDGECPDGGISALVAPDGRLQCRCLCENTLEDAPEGWRAAFRAVRDAPPDLFVDGETITGPAQLVLLGLSNDNSDSLGSEFWPLERPPVASEILPEDSLLLLMASSGALIEDAAELSAFRALRADFAARSQSYFGSIPMYSPDSGPASSFFRLELMLRDEVPEKVRAALENAQGP